MAHVVVNEFHTLRTRISHNLVSQLFCPLFSRQSSTLVGMVAQDGARHDSRRKEKKKFFFFFVFVCFFLFKKGTSSFLAIFQSFFFFFFLSTEQAAKKVISAMKLKKTSRKLLPGCHVRASWKNPADF